MAFLCVVSHTYKYFCFHYHHWDRKPSVLGLTGGQKRQGRKMGNGSGSWNSRLPSSAACYLQVSDMFAPGVPLKEGVWQHPQGVSSLRTYVRASAIGSRQMTSIYSAAKALFAAPMGDGGWGGGTTKCPWQQHQESRFPIACQLTS